jgi:hypothetical protein
MLVVVKEKGGYNRIEMVKTTASSAIQKVNCRTVGQREVACHYCIVTFSPPASTFCRRRVPKVPSPATRCAKVGTITAAVSTISVAVAIKTPIYLAHLKSSFGLSDSFIIRLPGVCKTPFIKTEEKPIVIRPESKRRGTN